MSPRTRPELTERSSSLQPASTEATPKRRIFDWISEPRSCILTPFQRSVVDVDWEMSPLGPMKSWPAQLRHMVLMVVADHTPAVIYWGDEEVNIYNEAYIPLVGSKHPALQGPHPKIELAEVWDYFGNLLRNQRETGLTVMEQNQPLMLMRHGFMEETYFSWKFVAVIGDQGLVVGSYCTVVEVTRDVISQRRLSVGQALGREISAAKNISEVWSQILRGLEQAEKDVPLALLYSIGSMSKDLDLTLALESPEKTTGSVVCNFEGSLGLPDGHPVAPITFDILQDKTCLAKTFRGAAKGPTQNFIKLNEGIYAESKLEGIPWRGYGAPNSMVVCPICSTNTEGPVAFLVIALSPVRPYDEEYRSFIQSLTEQITTPQISTILFREQARKRLSEARLEAINRAELSQALSSLTVEFKESEIKFARFAARAQVGLAIFDETGFVLYANTLWNDLVQLDVSLGKVSWENSVVAQDLDFVCMMFQKLKGQPGQPGEPATFQFRVKRPWKTPTPGEDGEFSLTDTHVLCSAYPDMHGDGHITIMSCLTDISELKWIEAQLRRRTADVEQRMHQAIETKKQQERFIDMTSHEMRNPLSAMIHCADAIITSINDYRSMVNKEQQASDRAIPLSSGFSELGPCNLPEDLLDDVLEAADTIIYCALHQKRIVDDTLALSRLDAELLTISPEAEQPVRLFVDALKIFDLELKEAAIKLDFEEEQSLLDLKVKWIMLDSSRVLQVFINLMTNAIKFTRTEGHRRVLVEVGASLTKPSELNEAIEYTPESRTRHDHTSEVAWSPSEIIYLTVSIRDSGRGLGEEERSNLFQVFQQASPKTYARYGGSGLGLFISRQLVEMQGGQIGLSSEGPGKGTTVRFFIKSRRTGPSAKVTKAKEVQMFMPGGSLGTHCVVGVSTRHDVAEPLERQLPGVPDLPARASGPSKNIHILVVEDNLVNQRVISKQLRKSGCLVTVANNGEEALQFIMRSEFWKDLSTGERLSVVLMDLEMPVMDGISCVQTIRKLQIDGNIICHIPVIAVTANARRDKIEEAMSAGMDDVTTKPYRVQNILDQIDRLMSTQQKSLGINSMNR